VLARPRGGGCHEQARDALAARRPVHGEAPEVDAVAVREQTGDAAYWTPNGYHRLTALKELGAKTVLALLVPERPVAYQILALNIEKAHNLREKAIGVRRMYVDLAPLSDGDEESFALEFEEPALATLGFAYEERGRLSGGAYHSILRKVDKWLPGKLEKAMSGRRERAGCNHPR